MVNYTFSFLYSITISFGGYSMFWITQFSDGCFNSWIDEMLVYINLVAFLQEEWLQTRDL